MNDTSPKFPRRVALTTLASAFGVGALACSGKAPPSCNDTTGLPADAVKQRNTVSYVDRAPSPEKSCELCVQWVVGPSAQECGGCRLFAGPVSPSGSCNVFAKRG